MFELSVHEHSLNCKYLNAVWTVSTVRQWEIYWNECGFKRESLTTIIHHDNYQVNMISEIIEL